MNQRAWVQAALAFVVAAGLSACGDDESNVDAGTGSRSFAQCGAASYVAFDSANHQNQDIRLSAFAQINAWLDEAKSDASVAADRFGKAKALYLDPVESANLQDKIKGRKDTHLAAKPTVGDRIDTTVLSWLDAGAAAETELQASVAKQWVDKTLQEFFFLSVHYELVQGTRKTWDEAFGYFGSGASNADDGLRGLALTAKKRDDTNGTNLRAQIFNNLIDGSCELAKAVDAAGAEWIDPAAVPAVKSIVDAIDGDMQRILAYSAGHEAFEMQALIATGFDISNAEHTTEMWVKMSELVPFVTPLLRIMEEHGGDSATRAAEIGALIGGADFSDPTLPSSDWMTEFVAGDGTVSGAARVMELLEAEYGIEIKG